MFKLSMAVISFLTLLMVSHSAFADSDLQESADNLYQQEKWSDAINVYLKLTEAEPNNEMNWYRLAHAHIQLKQGDEALKANNKLINGNQIPPGLVLYQRAIALSQVGQQKAMWESLEQSADAGFSNLKELENNPQWAEYKDSEHFLKITQKVDKNVRPCLYGKHYNDFDFWLGRWEVYGNAEKAGPLYGHNTISKTEQGCLIMEQWQGASGSTGTSMNYYDGIIGQWVQRWVSGGGTIIDYAGGLIELDNNNKAMQLVGKIYYASSKQQPQIRDFRGTWTPLNDGVVQQFFEESIDGGKTWYVWFNGFYFPLNE
ncbi:tetratricopeptide repeat protein [Marinicella litoralis]|uniref:Tetratricopeptide repeat protein n=1 Tax=Marinicella litoralis TaxID=644220 RepID=A0A4R6XW62_9GAMM|nr:tetratricopeptide repeat protein [Marinicella litoralis]TDR22809.1 hypothetical protein C8D91_1302 [Marinicella litoralis]